MLSFLLVCLKNKKIGTKLSSRVNEVFVLQGGRVARGPLYLFVWGFKSFSTTRLADLATGEVGERTRTTC